MSHLIKNIELKIKIKFMILSVWGKWMGYVGWGGTRRVRNTFSCTSFQS